MTDKEAYKLIADRAAEMAKNPKIEEYVRRKFNGDINKAVEHVYKMAVATLYCAPKSVAI